MPNDSRKAIRPYNVEYRKWNFKNDELLKGY